jgi:hypothetical protein
MPSDTKCKIAALCYTQKTNLDFQALTIEIGCALRNTGQGSTHRHDHYSDVVLFDLSDVRIALAHTDLRLEFSGDGALSEFAECLTISVSGTVDIPDAVVTSADLALLLQGVVDCIEHRLPSDQAFRFERDEIFTEVIYDQLIEHIWTMTQSSDAHAQDRARDSACTIKKQALIAIPRSAQPSGHQPDDAPPAVKTKSAHEQFSKWPTHPAAAADTKGAQALARSKGSSKEDAERIRLALYPLDENQDDALFENKTTQTTLHRAAIYTLNTSVMVFSLPVGAFLLTLSMAGRESMVLSSRLTAMTGSTIGLAQTQQLQSILSIFT